jgi:hypothetical protein
VANSFVTPSVPVDLNPRGQPMQRADIEFHGVDMSGSSFEARVFLNNRDAGIDTPQDAAHGYAGSFHVYGLGLSKNAAKVHPVTRIVTATEALRKAAEGAGQVSVTVVPVYYSNPPRSAADIFKVEKITVATS